MTSNTSPRVDALLNSLLIVAAELGPDFIHSDHGAALFQKGLAAIGILHAAFATNPTPVLPIANPIPNALPGIAQ